MRKPVLVLAVATLPFASACFAVTRVPVPATAVEREATELHGVVITDGTTEQEIEFEELHDVRWTSTSLSIVGDVRDDRGTSTVTHLIPITELAGLLVRDVDAGATSMIIGGLFVGGAAAIAVLVTGRADRGQGNPTR